MKTLLKRVIADDEKEERRMTIQGRTLGQLLQEKLAESSRYAGKNKSRR